MDNQPAWYNDIRILILGCLTLGLTPYVPEPHIWGKINWVMGGAKGMQLIDWWDLVMHGAPWLLMMVFLVRKFIFKSI